MLKTNSEINDSLVMCQTGQGVGVRGSLLHLTPHLAVFEIYNPDLALCTSEVLQDFQIVLNNRTAYSGRAVVGKLVNTGTLLVCEAKLDEGGFNGDFLSAWNGGTPLRERFASFMSEWQKTYRVLPEFKVIAADMQTFLADLRLWLEQAELEIRGAPAGDRVEMERRAARELGEAMVPAFDSLHERLEDLSGRIEEDLRPVHQSFAKRQLHPLVMCSPFAYRTFHKPLGYAGDYEMVNMIARDPYEGGSLFAKVMNLWFLSQWPARAHRNRIQYLRELLTQEALRGERESRPVRVLNLGCGPAREVQEFIAANNLCEGVQLTLLDFNEETIQHTGVVLEECKRRHGRRVPIQLQKKSVQAILKERSRLVTGSAEKKYDLLYCAGLFDYLPDRTCKQLMNVFYDWLVPGGLMSITNVNDCKPFRHMLEFVLDWHLIYRDRNAAVGLVPDRVKPEDIMVKTETTGVNIFVEARKAEHV